MPTDAQLVTAARDAGPGPVGARDGAAAFAALYDRYADRIHTFCYSRLRNEADAADALQEVFVNAHWRLHQLADPEKFRPWLFAIARTTVVDVARSRGRHDSRRDWGPVAGRRQPTDPSGLDVAAEQPGPERGLVAAESAALLWDAAAGLQPRDQELLELHLREGLEGGDLAAAMDVEPAHVYVMVKRMKTRLSTAVGSLLVARVGRDDCAELDALLAGWDGRFSLAIRSTITRHVESCDTCHATRRAAIAWESIAAAMPAAPAPAAVRLAVMAIITGGVVTGTGAGEAAASALPSDPPPTAEPTPAPDPTPPPAGGAPPDADSTGTVDSAARPGGPQLVGTALSFIAAAIFMTGAVLAWPVLSGNGEPDLIVTDAVATDVAGVAETAEGDDPAGGENGDGGSDGGGADGGADGGDDPPTTIAGGDDADPAVATETTTTAPTTTAPSPTTAPPPAPAPALPSTIPPTTVTTPPVTTTTAPPTTTSPPTTSTTTLPTTTTTSTTTTSTTTSPPTTTTTTTTTTTQPPGFSAPSGPIVFPVGADSVEITIANTGQGVLEWDATAPAPFGFEVFGSSSPKISGQIVGGATFTLTVLFDTTQPAGDYTGTLVFQTNAGDATLDVMVISPPVFDAVDLSLTTIYEGGPVCMADPTFPTDTKLTVDATDNSAVVSVVATWNFGADTVTLVQSPGSLSYEAVIGPYPVGLPSSLDTIAIVATDDDGHTVATTVDLTIENCPF